MVYFHDWIVVEMSTSPTLSYLLLCADDWHLVERMGPTLSSVMASSLCTKLVVENLQPSVGQRKRHNFSTSFTSAFQTASNSVLVSWTILLLVFFWCCTNFPITAVFIYPQLRRFCCLSSSCHHHSHQSGSVGLFTATPAGTWKTKISRTCLLLSHGLDGTRTLRKPPRLFPDTGGSYEQRLKILCSKPRMWYPSNSSVINTRMTTISWLVKWWSDVS